MLLAAAFATIGFGFVAQNPLGILGPTALLSAAGYAVEFTAASHDGGVDLVATKLEAGGLARSKLYVQCKVAARPVGVDAVRELIGSLPAQAGGVSGVLASRARFSAEARALARLRGIALWGPEELDRLGA